MTASTLIPWTICKWRQKTFRHPLLLTWFSHINSVDKNDVGDYLVSLRHLNSIVKVSGTDGSFLWRLGGKKSDFVLDGFNFTGQHNARFRGGNSSIQLISFLDNASVKTGFQPNSAEVSSGLLIALYTDEQPMTARIVQKWERPDGNLTMKAGNVQILDNGNAFICFYDRGYVTEFTADGRLVFEGMLVGNRNEVYRGHKYNFTASPVDDPTVMTFAYRINQRDAATVSYVSWNGATEVKTWRFHGSQNESTGYRLLGETKKTGFETVFTTDGYSMWNYVEAVGADGAVLGRSKVGQAVLNSAQHSGPGFSPNLPGESGSSVLKAAGAKLVIASLVGVVLLLASAFAVGWFVHKHKDRCWRARKSSEMGEYLKVEVEEEQRRPLAVDDDC